MNRSSLSMILLGIIGVMFVLQLLVPGFTETFYFDPAKAITEPWRFVTSMFLHSPVDFSHIIFNGYALFLFGLILESRIGKNKFLILFFIAGLVGSVLYYASILIGIGDPRPALGASGAIFGILGALAVILPNMRIFLFFFPMKMKHAAMLWLVLEFFGTFNADSGIASAAHLGGLVFGLIYAYFLKSQEKKEVDFYSTY